MFFFSSRRRQTRCALVTGVQTCALPISTTILAFLLQAAGREPGFLIGGVAEDFGVSARIGGGREFVVEADEYDTAFFDKRSKFVHYRPLVAILGNLEFDHADIFDAIGRAHV